MPKVCLPKTNRLIEFIFRGLGNPKESEHFIFSDSYLSYENRII